MNQQDALPHLHDFAKKLAVGADIAKALVDSQRISAVHGPPRRAGARLHPCADGEALIAAICHVGALLCRSRRLVREQRLIGVEEGRAIVLVDNGVVQDVVQGLPKRTLR